MNHRRRFGRRKSDKVVWPLAILSVLALIMTYTQSCGDSPTAPSPARTQTSTTSTPPSSQATTPAEPVADATPDPNAPQTPEGSDWKGYVKFDDQGNLSIFNPLTEKYQGEYCYFLNGPHPQTRLWAGETSVLPGHAKNFPAPDLAALIDWQALGKEQKEPVCEAEIQSDAGHKSFDCDRNSANLADAGTDHLHNYKYFDVKRPIGEWVEGEWEMVEEGEWGECQLPEGEVEANTVRECFKTRVDVYRKLWTRICSDETKEEVERRTLREPCKCPCEDMNVWTLTNRRNDGPWEIVVDGDNPYADPATVGMFFLGPLGETKFYGYDGQELHAFFRLYRYGRFISNVYSDVCLRDGGSWNDKTCLFGTDQGPRWPAPADRILGAYRDRDIGYDFADSAKSGYCGVEADVAAQWRRDALLSVECECVYPQ